MVEVSERIEVPAAPQVVWTLLSNPQAVVECVSGAELGDAHDDGSFDATVTVKFGPARVTFRSRVTLELDAAAMTGKVSARGKDNQGGTRFHSSMSFKVTEQAEPAGSAVAIDAQVEISGRLATLVETGAKLVIRRMTTEFAECLAARCAAPSSV